LSNRRQFTQRRDGDEGADEDDEVDTEVAVVDGEVDVELADTAAELVAAVLMTLAQQADQIRR